MTMFKRMLVPIDGTKTSRRALAIALALGGEQKATIHVLHVVDDSTIVSMFDPVGYLPQSVEVMIDGLRADGRKILEGAVKLASKSGCSVRPALVESRGQGVAEAILKFRKSIRADLIVMGTHGRRGMTRLLMGSDAEAVVRESGVPVLLVRSPASKSSSKRAKPAARSAG